MTRWAILTGEYPPQPGGVSDYTQLITQALAAAGDAVTVYSPPAVGINTAVPDVEVHRLPDHFGPRSLLALERALAALPKPDRILIQYVPHAFGWKAMNLPFTSWVAARARRIAPVWVMFHEVMTYGDANRPARSAVLTRVTRAMARDLARAADRVFVSIPAWGRLLRRICRTVRPTEWLPIPCVVPQAATREAIGAVRYTHARDLATRLVGHFSTYGSSITDILAPAAQDLLGRMPEARLFLLGRGGTAFRDRFAAANQELAARVVASGELQPSDLPAHLRACDLLLQPYPDGISSRRTTAMAGLANGVPVVTNLGVLSEPIWANGAGSVVARSPDPAKLADRAEMVLRLSPTERAELASRAIELYQSTFAIERTIARLRTPSSHTNYS